MIRVMLAVTGVIALAGSAYAGPCTNRISEIEKKMSTADAGSGPTNAAPPGAGVVAATPRQVPKAGEMPETGGTTTMNTVVGEKATSPADVRSQTQGNPTAAQVAQGGGRSGVDQSKQLSDAMAAAKAADMKGDAMACRRALDEASRYIKG